MLKANTRTRTCAYGLGIVFIQSSRSNANENRTGFSGAMSNVGWKFTRISWLRVVVCVCLDTMCVSVCVCALGDHEDWLTLRAFLATTFQKLIGAVFRLCGCCWGCVLLRTIKAQVRPDAAVSLLSVSVHSTQTHYIMFGCSRGSHECIEIALQHHTWPRTAP